MATNEDSKRETQHSQQGKQPTEPKGTPVPEGKHRLEEHREQHDPAEKNSEHEKEQI